MKSCINGATTMPYPLEADLAAAGAAGFEQVEIWAGKLDAYLKEHSPEDVKLLLAEYSLTVASICPYGIVFFGDVESAKQSIRQAAALSRSLGCDTLLVCPDSPPAGMSRDAAFEEAGRIARQYGDIVAEQGVRLAIEPLGMHPFVSGSNEALRILQEAGHASLGLMMDTFHYYKSGVSLEDVARIPVDWLCIVHVNDCEDLPREQLNDGHRLYPGEGILPLKETLRLLQAMGYQGALSVEIFRQAYWQAPAEEIARKSKASLESALAEME
ncbi:MAG: sugar phosphate isomerase/epimerase [Armatimonadetes bacterium]|nr:sugar phosphate isomerase/epimerase [Armatimonadota bacterium]